MFCSNWGRVWGNKYFAHCFLLQNLASLGTIALGRVRFLEIAFVNVVITHTSLELALALALANAFSQLGHELFLGSPLGFPPSPQYLVRIIFPFSPFFFLSSIFFFFFFSLLSFFQLMVSLRGLVFLCYFVVQEWKPQQRIMCMYV